MRVGKDKRNPKKGQKRLEGKGRAEKVRGGLRKAGRGLLPPFSLFQMR